jgi:hypothetical protein
MDLNSYMGERLARHAAHLNSLRRRRLFARPFYEIMSGALVWRDESHRDTPSELIDVLRCLWTYRTSVMLSEPREELAGVWRMAMQQCPHWVGFRAERGKPTPKMLRIYREGDVRLRKCLRDMERDMEEESGTGAGEA